MTTMTLTEVRDWHREEARLLREDGYDGLDHDALAAAIDAHLNIDVKVPYPMAESNAPDCLGPDEKQLWADGWNACRAAMLSAQGGVGEG